MFSTKKFISLDGKTGQDVGVSEVGEFDSSDCEPYTDIKDIPGMDVLIETKENGSDNAPKHNDGQLSLDPKHSIDIIMQYCNMNLSNPRLCAQVADKQTAAKVSWDKFKWKGVSRHYPTAAFGYKTVKLVGIGKDGHTIMCERYLETKANKGDKYIIKVWSGFAQEFLGNTKIVSWLMGFHAKENPLPSPLLRFTCKKSYMSYFTPKVDRFHECSADPEQWMIYISQLCNTQKWMLDNWGVLFWDWGFQNGRNYVLDHKNRVKWVDYGGIGIYVTDKFEELNTAFNRGALPADISKSRESFDMMLVEKDKKNIGHSRQIMMSFLFHLEYWYCKHKAIEPTVQYYSSLCQTGPKIMMEINQLLPGIFNYVACREIYEAFESNDWREASTWKGVGNKITTLYKEGKIK